DGRLEGAVGVAEARRKDGTQLDAVAVARLDDAVAALRGDLHRLLDDDVLARLGGGDGRLQVGAAGRADDDHVHVRPGQGGGQVRGGGGGVQPLFVGHRLGAARNAVEEGDEPGPGHVGEGAGVEAGDHPATDDSAAQRFVGVCHRRGRSVGVCPGHYTGDV